MRERVLKQFESIVGVIPEEEDALYLYCDTFDYIGVLMNCEKEFNHSIPDGDLKDEFDFETVKDFVDWVLVQVNSDKKI